MLKTFLFFLLIGIQSLSNADTKSHGMKLSKISDNVYAIVGELGNRSKSNYANNATFGFVITEEGVVLIDSGGSFDGAKAIHKMIQSVTNQPIVKVINTGGQDHRWMGNDYFQTLGAEIIASKNAVTDQKKRTNDQFFRLSNLIDAEVIDRTKPVYASTTFNDQFTFELGNENFEIYHTGQAHTPGDAYIWLPRQKIVFTGDIVYVERMLGVREYSNSKTWITVFESIANLKPQVLVPGHGGVTDLKTAAKDTYQYLKDLRNNVQEFYDNDGDISEIRKVSQNDYQYLLNYYTLSGQNAQQVFSELEWE